MCKCKYNYLCRLLYYLALQTLTECTVVDVNQEESDGVFDLNTVNSLHSFIKQTLSLVLWYCYEIFESL